MITSVIVNNLNCKGITAAPDETDSVAVVDPNTVLMTPVAFKLLQAQARPHGQVVEACCGIQQDKLLQSAAMKLRHQELSRRFAIAL